MQSTRQAHAQHGDRGLHPRRCIRRTWHHSHIQRCCAGTHAYAGTTWVSALRDALCTAMYMRVLPAQVCQPLGRPVPQLQMGLTLSHDAKLHAENVVHEQCHLLNCCPITSLRLDREQIKQESPDGTRAVALHACVIMARRAQPGTPINLPVERGGPESAGRGIAVSATPTPKQPTTSGENQRLGPQPGTPIRLPIHRDHRDQQTMQRTEVKAGAAASSSDQATVTANPPSVLMSPGSRGSYGSSGYTALEEASSIASADFISLLPGGRTAHHWRTHISISNGGRGPREWKHRH